MDNKDNKKEHKDFWRVINSDYVALFDPFRRYLDGLPPWDGKTNPIMELSSTRSNPHLII